MMPASWFLTRFSVRAFRAARRCLPAVLVALVPLLASAQSEERALPVLTLSVLQFGTPHWELDHLKRHGLDHANGFDLQVLLVADLPASRLALTSGSVDGAVSDLLWAQARYTAGTAYRYVPFSSQIGEVLVSEGSDIHGLADLRGKRIGVAGGPDGLGWQLLQRVAARQGIDLARDATVQYAAPPLLGQALRRGQIDALLTFWHFSARLRGEGGVRSAFRLADLLRTLDLAPDLPVLGYLFAEDWAASHEALLRHFSRALRQTKRALASSSEPWQAIRPLMRADDEAVFAALRNSFVEGIPQPLDAARIATLQRLLTLTGTAPAALMPAALFQSEP
ncbi:ABC transporter substrate-binding protein [Stutzerimonas stutzeri]|uniref:ABC transporter substrate-binding protein n=1 Tax=Stutzerimonas stutzeri TaxID=316 RepID=UPI0005EB9840